MDFIVLRKVGKRTYIYCGEAKGKSVWVLTTDTGFSWKTPFTYRHKGTAARAMKRLLNKDHCELYWDDLRREMGRFSIQKVNRYQFLTF